MNIPSQLLVFNNPFEVMEWITRQINHAQAHESTSTRLKEAHEYVQKYCMPEGWNKNVWHTILDDAIKMRSEK